jgi:hypothetical protein
MRCGRPCIGRLLAQLLGRPVGARLRVGGCGLVTGQFEVSLGTGSVAQGAPRGGRTRVERCAVRVDRSAVGTVVGNPAAFMALWELPS